MGGGSFAGKEGVGWIRRFLSHPDLKYLSTDP